MRGCLRIAVAVSALAIPAAAQDAGQSRLARGDAQIAIGSQHLHEPKPSTAIDPQNDWVPAVLFGAASVGWYWTDHQKTAIDFAVGTTASQPRDSQNVSGRTITYADSVLRVRQTNVEVSQQYQFSRNQWIHPHVAAGIAVARERRVEETAALRIFDDATRTTRFVGVPSSQSEGRTLVRPFGEVGVKVYMTRRVFYSGDLRVRVGRGIDDVRLRFGLGADF